MVDEEGDDQRKTKHADQRPQHLLPGTWTIEGDRMCFAYGEDPATCWGVRLSGNSVTWVGDRGDEGTGTIEPGNPQKF